MRASGDDGPSIVTGVQGVRNKVGESPGRAAMPVWWLVSELRQRPSRVWLGLHGVLAVEDHPFHLAFEQRDRYTGIAF